MSEGPLFPKKSDTDAPDTDPQPVQIQRSDDPDFGQSPSETSGSTQSGVPNVQGRKVGCSSVFLLMLVGVALMVAGRVLL